MGPSVPINPGVIEIGFEFEPKEGWNNLKVQQKEYKAMLVLRTVDQKIKHRFVFQVRSQNMQAIEMASNEKETQVVNVPIVRN